MESTSPASNDHTLNDTDDSIDTDPAKVPHFYWIFIGGYIISILFIILAMFNLTNITKTNQTQKHVQVQTFSAIVIDALFKIMHCLQEILILDFLRNQIFHYILLYFHMTMFVWQFISSFYSYKTADDVPLAEIYHRIWIYTVLGWAIPLILVAGYVTTSSSLENWHKYCPLADCAEFIFINIPIIAMYIVSVYFWYASMVVIRNKILETDRGIIKNSIKTVRSGVTLLMAFGLTAFPSYMSPLKSPQDLYSTICEVMNSLQGLLSAIALCFCNKEVRSILKAKYDNCRNTGSPKPTSPSIELSANDRAADADIELGSDRS